MHYNRLKKSYFDQPDLWLLGSVVILMLFGLLALISASSIFSFNKWGSAYHIFFNQILKGVVPGLVLFFIFYKINYQIWKKYYRWFFVVSFILLASVFIPQIGQTYNNARSWINLGFFSFQPAEIVKLFFLIFLAAWFENKGYYKVRSLGGGLISFIFILAIILLPIVLQPDLGTMIIIAFSSVVVYFVAGAPIYHLLILALTAGSALGTVMATKSYLMQRVLVFFNPGFDSQNLGYHITQAFIAVGSGGLFGRGFMKSQQKFAYLPEVYGDSIFAIIAEELGFIISIVLIAVFLVLIFRGLSAAKKTFDPFGKFLACGISAWLGFQALLNIAMMVGLAPLTGIPLPFISYGGTALAVTMGAVGLLLNISKQTFR